jgi:hypothetical protein
MLVQGRLPELCLDIRPGACKNTGWMHVHVVTPAPQLIVYLLHVEDTPGAIKICKITGDKPVPGSLRNSPGERFVEQE